MLWSYIVQAMKQRQHVNMHGRYMAGKVLEEVVGDAQPSTPATAWERLPWPPHRASKQLMTHPFIGPQHLLRQQGLTVTWEQVHAAGGLRVISAAAQPNRRAEAQLRGRAGRRGDPGETFSLLSCFDEYAMAASGLVRSMVNANECESP